jgi:hypothetical protein
MRCDVVAIAGAWAIGNAGCFLAGCCVGNPTSGPFGVSFSADQTSLELRGVHVHPVQLYTLMLEGAVVAVWSLWIQAAPGARFLSAVASLLLMKVTFASTGIAGGSSVVVVCGYTTLAAIAVVLGLLVGRSSRATA